MFVFSFPMQISLFL